MKKALYFTLVLFLIISVSSCVAVVKPRPVSHKTVYVKKPPATYRVVYVKGKKYTCWGGKHYRKTPRGHVYVKL